MYLTRKCVYCGRKGKTYLDAMGLYACAEHRYRANAFFEEFLWGKQAKKERLENLITRMVKKALTWWKTMGGKS